MNNDVAIAILVFICLIAAVFITCAAFDVTEYNKSNQLRAECLNMLINRHRDYCEYLHGKENPSAYDIYRLQFLEHHISLLQSTTGIK